MPSVLQSLTGQKHRWRCLRDFGLLVSSKLFRPEDLAKGLALRLVVAPTAKRQEDYAGRSLCDSALIRTRSTSGHAPVKVEVLNVQAYSL